MKSCDHPFAQTFAHVHYVVIDKEFYLRTFF